MLSNRADAFRVVRCIAPRLAGCPIRKARKAAVRDNDGRVIAFPYMPRVAQLPRGWRRWSPAEKIEHLLVMSLDQGHEILSWPVAELDPPQLAVQEQMRHVMYVAGLRARAAR